MAAANSEGAHRQPKLEVSMTDGESVSSMAQRLIEQYGDEAAAIAHDRAEALFDLGNIAGSRAWIRILELIEAHQRTNRPHSS